MSVNGITPLLDHSVAKPSGRRHTSIKSSSSRKADFAQVLFNKDRNYAFKVYTEVTLKRLRAVVGAAAEKLGVDLEALDTSPEATSDRIAGFAISMFHIYQKQHPEMSEEEALAKYDGYIRKAVDKGFNEALKIIQGLCIDSPKIMDDISKTYDLVQQKLDNFFAGALG